MKYLIIILTLILISCTPYNVQYTMYKPANETMGWKIECKYQNYNYYLSINDSTLLQGAFDYENNFEAKGTYKGHKIQLFGYRGTISVGESWTAVTEIRLIVDESEVTKFVF
ncbi:MAG: hypothetical protein V1779_04535 [bacterium]